MIYVLFAAFVLVVCALGFIGGFWGWLTDHAESWQQRRSQRRVDRMVADSLTVEARDAAIAAALLIDATARCDESLTALNEMWQLPVVDPEVGR